MTVHSVKISVSNSQETSPSTEPSPGPPDWTSSMLKDRVNENVFNDLNEVLPGQASSPSKRNTSIDGTGTDYIGMIYRVDSIHSKTDVLDKFEQNVVTDGKWYRIEYHTCTHDGDTRTVEKTRTLADGTTETYTEEVKSCGNWGKEREKGIVPDGV